jgi:hypothetical protein
MTDKEYLEYLKEMPSRISKLKEGE